MTTENLRTANGSQSEFSIDFTLPEFTSEIDVYVVNASTGALDKQTENTDYTIDTTNSKVVFDSAHIPAAGTDNVVIIRNTDVTTAAYKRSFTAGSSIRAQDLNANFTRLFEADEDKVQNADIATSAINTSNISKGAVTGEKIATKTITDTNISNSAEIQASKLKSKDITNTQIADNAAISGSKLAAATTSNPGSMSASDKDKLNGIEANAINASNAAITNKLPLTGGTIDGNVRFNDGKQLQLGSDGDLKIKHSGSLADIVNNTGNLRLETGTGTNILFRTDDNDGTHTNLIICDGTTGSEHVDLLFNNGRKATTVTDGLQVLENLKLEMKVLYLMMFIALPEQFLPIICML